mmetsp:Transcript_10897/g.30087  ORF Transcript_10897/g.30087 Transcript_10897/m.30087 type:complete len:224 (+) Transcript_10897:293-964(+)
MRAYPTPCADCRPVAPTHVSPLCAKEHVTEVCTWCRDAMLHSHVRAWHARGTSRTSSVTFTFVSTQDHGKTRTWTGTAPTSSQHHQGIAHQLHSFVCLCTRMSASNRRHTHLVSCVVHELCPETRYFRTVQVQHDRRQGCGNARGERARSTVVQSTGLSLSPTATGGELGLGKHTETKKSRTQTDHRQNKDSADSRRLSATVNITTAKKRHGKMGQGSAQTRT